MPQHFAAEVPISARHGATIAGLSLAAFWRAVAVGRMPAPFYPASRAPRWLASEIMAALALTRSLPREAKELRRRARIQAATPIVA